MKNGRTIKTENMLFSYLGHYNSVWRKTTKQKKNKHISTPKQIIALWQAIYLCSLGILGQHLFVITELERVLEMPQLSLLSFQIIVLEATIYLICLLQKAQTQLKIVCYSKICKENSLECFDTEPQGLTVLKIRLFFTSPEKDGDVIRLVRHITIKEVFSSKTPNTQRMYSMCFSYVFGQNTLFLFIENLEHSLSTAWIFT